MASAYRLYLASRFTAAALRYTRKVDPETDIGRPPSKSLILVGQLPEMPRNPPFLHCFFAIRCSIVLPEIPADDGWLVDVVGLAKPGWNTSDDISETWSNNARCWSFLPQLDLCKNFCVNQKGGATRGVVGLLCLWPTGSAPPVPSPPPSPPTHPNLDSRVPE
ncbi:hypothetical protein CMUS01_13360 [Colletotrichum musicola]|uniref:Uncharacterized protein n=1 Tax=Colletotrichum musicola TaxID=2175873 RepID=A0A8H6MWN0_9PEZI|nr:hypothetical protein CMUS01_13360 [Colletotrichum musicola]